MNLRSFCILLLLPWAAAAALPKNELCVQWVVH